MNRTTALFLAVAILVAHALAIHANRFGDLAPPSDYAHVPYRVARNWIQSGHFAWDLALPAVEGTPSLLWTLVAAMAERVYVPVTNACQAVGAVCALATVPVLARFSRERMAGVMAPLLFVICGSAAAAAGSGSETAAFALILTFCFLCFERRRRTGLAVGLALAVLARPEGAAFAAFLLLFELSPLRPPRPAGLEHRPRSLALAFAAPALVVALLALRRYAATGSALSPWLAILERSGPELWRSNLRILRDSFVGAAGPALFVFPLWYLSRGALGGLGVRACLLTVLWCATVVAAGARPEPASQALVPVLAILFVAVQEAMTLALDSSRRWLPRLTWVVFALGLLLSALASKFPGDLGPLRVERLYSAWVEPRAEPRFGHKDVLARYGVQEEIDVAEALRAIGLFLREQVDPGHSVLTPWPGAIGYLSRLRVTDLLNRATPAPGTLRTEPWSGTRRCDVLTALAEEPDYIVPMLRMPPSAPSVREIATSWADGLDVSRGELSRTRRIFESFQEYELITVPTTPFTRPGTMDGDRFYLMRRRDLSLSPRLSIEAREGTFRIEARHEAHAQVVDLRVQLVDQSGALRSLCPTGEFSPDPERKARSSILLFPTGQRAIELARGSLPADLEAVELRAVLLNPGARGESHYDEVSAPIAVRL